MRQQPWTGHDDSAVGQADFGVGDGGRGDEGHEQHGRSELHSASPMIPAESLGCPCYSLQGYCGIKETLIAACTQPRITAGSLVGGGVARLRWGSHPSLPDDFTSMQDAHHRAAHFLPVPMFTPRVRNCCKHEVLCTTPGIHIRLLAIVRALPHKADAHDHHHRRTGPRQRRCRQAPDRTVLPRPRQRHPDRLGKWPPLHRVRLQPGDGQRAARRRCGRTAAEEWFRCRTVVERFRTALHPHQLGTAAPSRLSAGGG